MEPWYLSLIVCFFSVLHVSWCCPHLCSCSDKYYRHFAECSDKGLTQIPPGLPPNVSTVSLSANRITSVPARSFQKNMQVTSLWMARNMINSVERGAISFITHLRNLDLSHNQLADFPWEDLKTLTSLQILKLDHNKLKTLPQNAFSNLKELNSLRLNNNRFVTIKEGTFNGLVALSYLQIYSNPFICTCSLVWLKHWIVNAKINITDQNLINCASPESAQGKLLIHLHYLKCAIPNVIINVDGDVQNGRFYKGGLLILTCEFTGNPQPIVQWKINSKKRLALMLTENGSAEMLDNSLRVYNNGTLVILNLKKDDSGVYSCSATNELGQDEHSVEIEVLESPNLTAEEEPETASYATELPLLTTNLIRDNDVTETKSHETLKGQSKCGLTSNTRYVQSHVFNGTFDNVKHYTFDFGVMSLRVSETEAIVTLKPFLKTPDERESEHSNGIFLCLTEDQNALQWTRIKEGVNMYQFTELLPGTNYSLCMPYKGQQCEVQVLFMTRKRVPNLIIIISVSICLLTVSTVPLLAATCFHLIYKYRCNTYKFILKARDQYKIEKASFRVHTESEKDLREDLVDERESNSGHKEPDTEESIVVDTVSEEPVPNECDGSEYSDPLPMGAEAGNITYCKY